jgi:hypothetical protein
MATTGKELLDKANSIKGGNAYDGGNMKLKAAISGGFVGVAAGFYYAYVKKENYLVAGILAGITGALIARVLMPK